MSVKPNRVDDGVYEWTSVEPGAEVEWLHVEKVARGVVHVVGGGIVHMLGSLFDDSGYEIMMLNGADPIQPLPFIPWRIRPRVLEGTATVRIYIPRG